MKKTPEGRSGENPEEEHPEKLREELSKEGLTDDQITDILMRMNAEDIFKTDRPKREPQFFYDVFAEKHGRPPTDLEKIQIKAQLNQSWEDLKKEFGLDKDGKQKKD